MFIALRGSGVTPLGLCGWRDDLAHGERWSAAPHGRGLWLWRISWRTLGEQRSDSRWIELSGDPQRRRRLPTRAFERDHALQHRIL